MGNNARTKQSSPVQTIAGGTNWKYVSCGGSNTAAIKTDCTLWTWGGNSYGQLGDNSRNSASSPIQTISGGANWKTVSISSGGYTGAIKTDGTLWMWGNNTNGTLADGTSANKSSPVQTIAGGTNWKYIACGKRAVVALNGTWGTIT
jgi:alpha-tubulin suppressor-like RCC1 family protein